MRILVTGFERFGPNDLNPTALLMDRLAGRERVIATVLPVEYHTSVRRFEALLDEHRPDAAVAFGLALDEIGRAAEIILRELGAGRGGTPSA